MNDMQKADHVQNNDPTQFECEGPLLLGHPRNLATGKPVSKAAKTEQAGQASACPDVPEATHGEIGPAVNAAKLGDPPCIASQRARNSATSTGAPPDSLRLKICAL